MYNSSTLNNSGGSDPDLDFEALRWTSSFVDKTMLIQCIMKDPQHRVLLTAPPRFGKTMAKNMLQMFYEIGDSERKLELFKDLKIYKCTEGCTDNHDCKSKNFFRQHCGQHPVISLDFALLSAESYSDFLESFRRVIAMQFQKYTCLIHKDGEKYSWSSNNIGWNLDIKRFLRYLAPANKDNYWMTANGDQKKQYIFDAFDYLIKVLSTHYQTEQTHKKIIVLIDEFDAPFMEMLLRDCSSDIIILFIQKLMRLLCKEEVSAKFVERVVIFSVTALGRMILVGAVGANNVAPRTFLDKHYDYYKFFGFTKEEVDALVERSVPKGQQQKALGEIAVWYNNYTIVGVNDTTICNPLSITSYLPNLVRRNYWVDAVGTKYVRQLFKFEKIQEKLFPAIRDDHNISINTTIQLDDIANFKSLSESLSNCVKNNQVDLALQFLTECGYFNVIKKESSSWTLQIPNQELKEALTNKLYHALLEIKTEGFDVKQDLFVNALESLGCGKEHEPTRYVTFKKSVENLYANRELPKAQFHFHCDLWMLIRGSGKFDCCSKLPVKNGRTPKLDLIIITESGTGIIIEVKRHKADSAKKGLEQCLKKEYYKAFELEEYRNRVVNTILMGLHLSDNGKASIRYLENFESKTLSDEQNRETLMKTVVENSYECSDM